MKALNTTYDTSYDRDRTRGLWNQAISYGTTTGRSTFNLSGNLGTMEFLRSDSKSTIGSIDGALSTRTFGSLLAILTGNFDMNSAKNGPTGTDTRDNRINLKLQQLVNHKTLTGIFAAFTEFEVKQDRTRNDFRINGDPFSETPVDSTIAERDSSYTSSRMDGVNANVTWAARPALSFRTMAQAYQVHPSITFFNRSFVHALDSLGTGFLREAPYHSERPTANLMIDQWLTYTGIRRTNISLYGARRHQTQSYYDKQRNNSEFSSLDNTQGTFHVDTSLLRRIVINTDASLGRNLNRYELNSNLTKLSNAQKVLSTVSYADTARRATVTFSVDRTHTELLTTSAGVEINRLLSFNGSSKMSSRLTLDALGSVGLGSNDYVINRNDQDVQRTFASVGGGFLLAPACSTTVHFSRASQHTVALDPDKAASNAVNTTYQLNATLRYVPNRDFAIIQSYVFSANYRILDYAEQQNYLVRSRRVDTDLADTLWSVAFFHLEHNFVYGDEGSYARFGDAPDRLYRVASQHYNQTLTATAGLKILPGVVFTAIQGLVNDRVKVLANDARTLQNTFRLNMGLDVCRSFDDGLGIQGAVRRIEEYVENTKNVPRRDWIAGVSIHKAF
ncbi:MAG: hypothetical protein ACM3PF_08895 [Bacteroidota bacterium]